MDRPAAATARAHRRLLLVAGLLVSLACAALFGSGEPTSAPFTDRESVGVSLQAGGGPLFVPDLVLWLDGADAGTLFADPAGTVPAVVGDAVARWEDKSPSGNDASQAAPSTRPVLQAGSPAAVPVFDGADGLSLDPTLLPTGTTASMTFVVARLDGGSHRAAFAHGTGGAFEQRWFGTYQATRGRYITASGGGNPTTTAWPVGAPGLLTGVFADAAGTVRADGGNAVTVAGAFDTGSSFAVVGGPGSQKWIGAVHEVLVYERDLSASERRTVETYLAGKWGLTLTPAPPTAVTATASDAGALTVSWTPPTDTGGAAVTGYSVQYRAQGASTWTTHGTAVGTTATITGLTVGTTYELRVAATNAAGTGDWSAVASAAAQALWTPADLPGGLAAWFDASDASTLTTSGGAVTEWRDRSGFSRHVTQTTAANRPVLSATGWAGSQPAVVFDGTNDGLGLAAPIDLSRNVGGQTIVAAAHRTGGDPDYGTIFGTRTVSSGTNRATLFAAADGATAGGRRLDADGFQGVSIPGPAGPAVSGAVFDWANAQLSVGLQGAWTQRPGGFQTPGATSNTSSVGGGVGSVGGSVGGDQPFGGAIGEIVVAPSALTTADLQRLEGYLAHRWGTASSLPAGHPYRDAPPLTATPVTAPAAPGAVTATPGDGDLQVSWTAPASGGTPIRDYVVEYRIQGSGGWLAAADGVSTTTSATIGGLTNGTAYEVRVRAVNAAGTGAGATATATPLAYRAAVLADAPVAYWRLGESSGTTFRSETGSDLSLTTAGTVTSTTADALSADSDRAVELAGAGDLRGPNAAAVQLTEGTVEAWVRATAPGGSHRGIVVKPGAYGLFLHDGVVSAYDWGTATNRSTGINVADGQWHHVAMTFRSGVPNGTVLYVDGQPALTTTITVANQNVPAVVGAGDASGIQRLTGSVDEAAIYGTVLSPARIAAHHRAGITGVNDGVAPAAPTGLTATPSTGQIALSWTAVADSDLVGYRVFRDGTLVAQQTGTTFADTGRTDGVTHTYTVEAYDLRGNRSATASTSAMAGTAPAAPGSVTATPTGDRAVTVTWSAPANGGPAISDYVVQYRTNPSGSWVTLADGVGAGTSAAITGLTAGTAYDVRVAAVNAIGTGPWSSAATVTAQALWTPADLSAGLSLWLDAADASTLVLDGGAVAEWRDRSGNGRHATQVTASLRPAYSATAANGRPALVFTNHQLDMPAGVYAASPAIAVAMHRGTSPHPGARLVLSLQNTSEIIFAVNYQTATNFWFTRRGASQFRQDVATASAGGVEIYVGDSGVSNGTSWSHRYNGTAPSQVGVGIAGGSTNANSMGRSFGGGHTFVGTMSEVAVTEGNLPAADLERLEGYLAHKWGTTASLPAGHPYKTVPPLIATPASAPAAPGAPVAVPRDGSVQLSWTAPATGGTPIRDYVVQYATDSAFTAPVTFADGLSAGTSATVTGLTNGTAYWFRIAAVNAAGTGAWSASTTVAPTNLWTPADLSGGLAAWYDAAAPSSVTHDGSGVSQWADRSGNGRHAVQPTASARPSYDPATSTISQTAGRYLSLSGLAGSASFNYAAAYRTTDDTFILFSSGVGNTLHYGYTAQNSGMAELFRNFGSPSLRVNGAAAAPSTRDAYRQLVGTGARVVETVTGASVSAWSAVNLGYYSPDYPQYHYSGDLNEIVVLSAVPSAADRERLEGYLAHKWGTTASLPANHPYKAGPPMVGAPTAPTGVSATGGDGSVTLSWTAPPAGYLVTDYTVQHRALPSGSWTTLADGVSTATTATVTGLTASTEYELRVAAVNATGTGSWSATAATTTAAWTPADLSGVALWLDAADASRITLNGSTVSAWTDKSGNGRHATQATASAQPTYVTGEWNGRPVLRFDGTDSLIGSSVAGDQHVFLVADTNTTSPSRMLLGFGSSSGTTVDLLWHGGALGVNTYNSDVYGITDAYASALASRSMQGWYLSSQIANTTFHLDGAAQAIGQRLGTTANRAIAARLAIGASPVGDGYFWNGDISEIVTFGGALSTADRQRLEGYLAHKWGTTASLPADHPYKSAPPRVGLPTAPTGVSATGGDGSVTVQWTAPDAGFVLTDYVVQYLPPAGTWTTFADGTSAATSATVTGLTAATTYDFRVAAVNAAGTGAWSSTATAPTSSAWNPADLPGLALWLDADDAPTITLNGSSVSQWNDKSGNGRHATQATAVNQPTYSATGLNGRPSLSFDGSTATTWSGTHPHDFLSLPTGFLNGAPAFSLAMVMRGPGQTNNAIFGPQSANSTGLELVYTNLVAWPTLVRINNVNRVISGFYSTDDLPTLSTLTSSASTTAGWSNGSSLFSTTGNAPLSYDGVYSLGRYSGGYHAAMNMADFIVTTSSLSTADRQRLEGYLAHKWGLTADLPAGHPYRTAPPLVGVPTAPTGVAATPGDGSVTLQWTAPNAGFVVTDYVVQYLPPEGSWTTFADGTSTATSATVTGLTVGTAYDVRVAAVNAAGTGAWSATATGTPNRPWTPADLSPAPEWWLDATTGVTTSSGVVTTWASRSGSGSLTVPDGSTGPTLETSRINGLPTLRFTNDALAGPDLLGGTTESLTTVVVLRENVASNNYFINLNGYDLGTDRLSLHGPFSDRNWYWDAGGYGTNRAAIGGNATAVGAVTLGTFWKDQALGRNGSSLNGGAFTAQSGGWTSAATTGGLHIGQYTTDHELAEYLAFDRRLSAADQARLEGYLAHKWGTTALLPAGHPYKTAPPTVP